MLLIHLIKNNVPYKIAWILFFSLTYHILMFHNTIISQTHNLILLFLTIMRILLVLHLSEDQIELENNLHILKIIIAMLFYLNIMKLWNIPYLVSYLMTISSSHLHFISTITIDEEPRTYKQAA